MSATQFVLEEISVDDVTALDLREEITKATTPVEAYHIVRIKPDGYRDSVPGVMLWFPNDGRAGIEWGGDADWTDAVDPQDAAERYFGIDRKEMCN